MTKEEAIVCLKGIKDYGRDTFTEQSDWQNSLDMAIKALEQQPSEDIMAIHTQGLDEGIRCAMCTNSMKSDRGCDGGCVVNEDMYKKVMETIKNHTMPLTPDMLANLLMEERIRGELKQDISYSKDIYSQSQIRSMPKADVVEREKVNKAIEEIEKIDLIVHDGINHYYKDGEEVIAEALKILKRNIGERSYE